nr:protein shisa-5-like isoform X1 [Dermacentor andersoni]
MNVYVLLSLAIVFLTTFVENALATTCTREVFDITQYFTCPGPVDRPTERYCCGTKKFRYCCDLNNYSDAIYKHGYKNKDRNKLFNGVHSPKRIISKSVGAIIGVIIVIIIAVVVVVIVSCFCCSCCLLARRRQQRGRVLVGGGQTGGTAATAAQPMVPPTMTPYPQQPYPQQPYPQQPPAGYPVQPAPMVPAMPAPGFGYYASPYGNPPPYTDNVMPVQQPAPMQQPPFNPSYPAK